MSTPSQYYNQMQNNIRNPLASKDNNPNKILGIVMENHIPGHGNKIKVLPVGALPLVKGVATEREVKIRQKFTDASGRPVVAKGNHTNYIVAEYFSTDSYRKTAPNVQRGERVHIWMFGNTNTWFWEPTSLDSSSIRRQETVVQSINADPPDGKDSGKADSSNSYFMEMSSHNKSITLGTSQANEEVAGYRIQINAGGGSINIQDDVGNFIELKTGGSAIWMKNACGTEVKLYENNILMKCNENMDIDVGKNLTAKVGGDLNIEVGGNTVLKTADLKVDTPKSTFTGNVAIEQGLSVTGASEMGGGGTVRGHLQVEGTHTVTGPVQLSGGSSSGVIYGSYIDT